MHFGCERKKSRIGDWIGVSTVVARTPSSVASSARTVAVEIRTIGHGGQHGLPVGYCRSHDLLVGMARDALQPECLSHLSAQYDVTKGRTGIGTVSKNARVSCQPSSRMKCV